MIRFMKIVCAVVVIIALSGCATFNSLNADVALSQRIFIYSGTRLDWAAIEQNAVAIRKFNAIPPRYPLIDCRLALVWIVCFCRWRSVLRFFTDERFHPWC